MLKMVINAAAALLAGLAVLAGCAETEDLTHYARLAETKRILLLDYPVFIRSKELFLKEKAPAGEHIAGDEAARVVELLETVEKTEMPPEADPAFAMVFYPEDMIEFRALVLDQYLNFWPGFEYINEPFKGFYSEPPPEFKKLILAAIFRNRGFTARLMEMLKSSEPDALSRPENTAQESED